MAFASLLLDRHESRRGLAAPLIVPHVQQFLARPATSGPYQGLSHAGGLATDAHARIVARH